MVDSITVTGFTCSEPGKGRIDFTKTARGVTRRAYAYVSRRYASFSVRVTALNVEVKLPNGGYTWRSVTPTPDEAKVLIGHACGNDRFIARRPTKPAHRPDFTWNADGDEWRDVPLEEQQAWQNVIEARRSAAAKAARRDVLERYSEELFTLVKMLSTGTPAAEIIETAQKLTSALDAEIEESRREIIEKVAA